MRKPFRQYPSQSGPSSELADENVLRYGEWRELLQELVSPLVRNPLELEHEVAVIVALVDGLGLRLARHTPSDSEFETQQCECTATLMRHLARYETD
jgi:hypothetical protein